jgi:hypothetical protein
VIDERAEALAQRGFACFGAGAIAAIIALAAWGTLAPWAVDWVELGSDGPIAHSGIFEVRAGIETLLGAAFLAGGFVAGRWGWAIVVQRRRPWPLARRRADEQVTYRWPLVAVPYVTAYLAARLLQEPGRGSA